MRLVDELNVLWYLPVCESVGERLDDVVSEELLAVYDVLATCIYRDFSVSSFDRMDRPRRTRQNLERTYTQHTL